MPKFILQQVAIYVTCCLLLCLVVFPIHAQLEGTHLTLSDSIHLQFSNDTTTPQVSQFPLKTISAAYSDKNGNPICYIKGKWDSSLLTEFVSCLYDRNLNIVPGSSEIEIHPYRGGAFCLLPHPTQDSIIIVVSIKKDKGLFLHQVCVQENETISMLKKNEPIDTISSFNLAVVKHANGRDWWIATISRYNKVFMYLYDCFSIRLIHTFSSIPLCNGSFPCLGQLSFSNHGNKLGIVSMYGPAYVFDFDRCTGLISNPISLGYPYNPFPPGLGILLLGVSFSPNERFCYLSSPDSLFQLDLEANNVQASKQTIFVDTFPTSTNPNDIIMLRGHFFYDNKIYIYHHYTPNNGIDIYDSDHNKYWAVIHHPDSAGLACQFEWFGLSSGGRIIKTEYPPPNYKLGGYLDFLAEAGNDTVLACAKEPVLLGTPSPRDGLLFQWAPAQNLSCPTCAQTWAYPDTSTDYKLMVYDTSGGKDPSCYYTYDCVNIKVLSPLENLPDTIACTPFLYYLVSGRGQYSWSNGTKGDSILLNETGLYWYELIDTSGCILRDSFTVTFAPTAISLPENVILCGNESVTLDATQPGALAYFWHNGTESPELQVNSSGVYKITVSFEGGCNVTDSLVVQQIEMPVLSLPTDTTLCLEKETLVLTAPTQVHATWQPGNIQNRFFSVKSAGEISVILITPEGCIGYDTLQVHNFCAEDTTKPDTLKEVFIVFPNAFSPNNDGINDVWFPIFGEEIVEYRLQIWDRWGTLVFESRHAQEAWSGTGLPEGVYAFQMEGRLKDNRHTFFVGTITLLR